jgi:hypothetical protein
VADYTTPPTFSSGAFLTAAQMNAYVRDNTAWIRDAMSRGPYYAAGGTAGSAVATDLTDIMDITTIPTPNYPYRMSVVATGMLGGNAAPNQTWLILTDRIDGVPLSQTVGMNFSGFTIVDCDDVDDHRSFALAGYRDLDANEPAGWRLQYKVTTSNIFIDCHALAWITPQPD